MRFAGKSALVTGSSRGIGRSIAIRLAQEGADVAVHHRDSEDRARKVCAEIESLGRKAVVVQADVTDRQRVNAMAEEIVASLGSIDLLVNNAGELGAGNKSFDELSGDDWDRIIAVNLTGTFNVLWAVKPFMISRRSVAHCTLAATSNALPLGDFRERSRLGRVMSRPSTLQR